MDLTEGDYLQVHDDQFSGKMTYPVARIIRKSSAGVIFSGQHGNSTGFQCSFLCIGECNSVVNMISVQSTEQHKRAWADSILHNDEVMEVIKVDCNTLVTQS